MIDYKREKQSFLLNVKQQMLVFDDRIEIEYQLYSVRLF